MASKFALIIANTEYSDPGLAQLMAPGMDAREFGRVLDSPELGAFNDVIILFNENSAKAAETIDHFFSAKKPDDLLLLYFSGHGVRDEYGSLYLAVKNTNRARLRSTAIKSDFIREAMDESRSKRQVLILDCCNSGAFAQGTKAELGGNIGTAKAFEGTGYGRIVLTASDSTQFAWEGDKVIGQDTSNSLFTHFLVKGLEGEADQNSDGKITVDELYDYAYEQVVERTPKQTPGKWSYKQQGDIVLRENLKPRDVKPAPLPSEFLELLAHSNPGIRRMGVQDLVSLLDGKHLGLARAAEEKLRAIVQDDDSFALRKTAYEVLLARGFAVDQPAPPTVTTESSTIREEQSGLNEPENKLHSQPIPFPAPKRVSRIPWYSLGWIVGGLLVVGLLIWGVSRLLQNMATVTAEPTPTIQTSVSPKSNLGIGETMIGNDGMTLVSVPAGEFTMGSNVSGSDQRPAHTVYLDAFWIDKTEVTNGMYAQCVQSGSCEPPEGYQSSTRQSYFDISEFKDYPVIYVSWDDANAYCEWAGRRLPTEAEWEKAARGENAFLYPWGNDAPDSRLLNYNNDLGDTSKVGNYPDGASPYGALDMAGNVWEWVADWYDATYYANAPRSNPPGPDSGTARVRRGASWVNLEINILITGRGGNVPPSTSNSIGFRCALSANAQTSSSLLTQVVTDTPQPMTTDVPSETSISPTPTLGIGSTMTSDRDGMILLYVPAGEFTMGGGNASDQQPAHPVTLDAFWIDQTEVTNKMYSTCVDASECKEPVNKNSREQTNYFRIVAYNNFPVLFVDWEMAKTYCQWVDRRLPTEAEWEKAARGTDGRIYPWGNDAPNGEFLNFNWIVGDVSAVGSYVAGKSPSGAYDMAGNVWEWVHDLYSESYYQRSPPSNPLGPESGEFHVQRGGSWLDSSENLVRSTARDKGSIPLDNLGFRCAMSAAQ